MISEAIQGKQNSRRRPVHTWDDDVNRGFTYNETTEPKKSDVEDEGTRVYGIISSMWRKSSKIISHDDSVSRYVGEAYKSLQISELSATNAEILPSWKKMVNFMVRVARVFDSTCEYAEFPKISTSDDGLDLYWRYGIVNLLVNFPYEQGPITFHGINSDKEEFMGSFAEIPLYIIESIVEWLKQEWNGK